MQNSLRINNIQEQKNRATEKEAEKDDVKHRVPTKDVSNKSPAQHLRPPVECKECVMTPSGRILAFSASTKLTDTPPEVCRTAEVSVDNPPRIVRNSFSSSSIPSVLATKEQIKNMLGNEHPAKKEEEMTTDFSTSKSLQEITTSTTTKGQKTAINTKKKHVEKTCHHSLKDKKHKENKNELVKKEIEKILRKNFDITTTSTVSSSTGKSNVKKSHDSECCHRSPKRKQRGKIDVSSGSAVSESSTDEEETSEDTGTDTESSRDKRKKIKEKKRERERKEKGRRHRERERRDRKEKEKHKSYDSSYEKCRKCKLGRSSSKKNRGEKSSRRKKESNTDEDEDDEDGQYSEFSVYHYTKKNERNPFASKSGIVNPVVYCSAEKKPKPTCSICGIIHVTKCSSSPPRHSPPRHSPPRHSPPRHSPPRTSPPRPPPLPMRKCCSEVKSSYSVSPPKEKSKCCSPPPKCPTVVQVDVPCPVDCPMKKPSPEADSCTFKNFFKNLRNFAHLPLGKLGYCDKEPTPPVQEKNVCTLQVEDCSARCPLKKKPEPIKTCRCVKIFLQRQSQQQEWPGARPFDGFSEGTDFTSYSSECEDKEKEKSCPSSQGSPLYCLNLTESMPCDCSQIMKKKRREKCVCDKCGNVHKKKKPKKSRRRRSESDSEEEKEDCEHQYDQTHPVVVQPDPTKKTSIIKNYNTKANPTQKSKSSIFQRIAEVRRLKTCKLKKKIRELKHPQVKVDSPGRPASRDSSRTQAGLKKRCDCDPRWAAIERKIRHLEEDKKDKKKKKKKKKNKGVEDDTRRKNKQRKLREEELDEKSCTCCTCRKRKRKKRKKEERKRKKDGKKRKGKLSCKKYCKHEIKFHSKYGPHISLSQSDTMTPSQQSEKDDFLEKCTREKREKRMEGKREDTKIVQHATFCCTCNENETPFKNQDCPEKKRVCGDKSDSSKKKRSFLERFSSISSLIRNWRNYGRERITREFHHGSTTNEELIDDASKSSQYPREKGVSIAEAPISFKKAKKPKKPKMNKKEKKEVKKETREKKKKEKKEKKEKYKEKYPKSKSRLRRHK